MFEHWLAAASSPGAAQTDERTAGRAAAQVDLVFARSTRAWELATVLVFRHGLLADAVEALHGADLAAVLTARTAGRVGALSADDQLCAVQGWAKVSGWAQAALHEAVGFYGLGTVPAVDDAVDEGAAAPGGHCADAAADAAAPHGPATEQTDRGRGADPRWLDPQEGAAQEVALVLGCPVWSAEQLLGDCVTLVSGLPGVLKALELGQVTVASARAIATEAGVLDADRMPLIEAMVLPGAVRRSPSANRRATKRAVARLDPAAAAEREQRARRGRCVRTSPADDGMANLAFYAPVAQVAGAFEVLDAHARQAAGRPGEQRGIEAIRTDLGLAALTGQLYLGPTQSPGSPSARPPTPATVGSSAGRPPLDDGSEASPSGRRRGRPTVRVEVVVTGAASTLAGLDDQPGELAGYGPITATTLRDLAAGARTIDVLTTDPATGSVTGMSRHARTDDARSRDAEGDDESSCWPPGRWRNLDHWDPPAVWPGYHPPAALTRYVQARDRTCRFPHCTRRAVRCDLDHTIHWPTGDTCAANLGPLCRRHHRLKQTPRWRLTSPRPGVFRWTTPSGRAYPLEPPDPLHPD